MTRDELIMSLRTATPLGRVSFAEARTIFDHLESLLGFKVVERSRDIRDGDSR